MTTRTLSAFREAVRTADAVIAEGNNLIARGASFTGSPVYLRKRDDYRIAHDRLRRLFGWNPEHVGHHTLNLRIAAAVERCMTVKDVTA